MNSSRRTLTWAILALVISIEGIVLLLRPTPAVTTAVTPNESPAAVAFAHLDTGAASSTIIPPTAAAPETAEVVTPSAATEAKKSPEPQQKAVAAAADTAEQEKTVVAGQKVAARIQNPYSFPPQTFATTDNATRGALVNILCLSSGGSIRPISGSGVIIDPRGVILTNAHVAQYVLLSEAQGVNLTCSVRTGSPAHAAWKATVMYMPMVWVNAHINDLNAGGIVTGTGEHDYALLAIGADGNTPLPASFSYLPIDTREAIGFLGDNVLVGGYPAEFIGGVAAQNSLYSLTSDATIQQLLTFNTGSVDLLSFKGVIEAQSGSSGGPVVNPWGRLIGIITTTSEAATTDARDLRAITLSYIDHDIKAQTGSSLTDFLSGSLADKVAAFNAGDAQTMLKIYLARINATQ